MVDFIKHPHIVLFSGGSASNTLARHLNKSGVNTSHVIAVFDNGGSTGALRRIASVPAMGDIRNRLEALAPGNNKVERAIKNLFALRLSDRKAQNQLKHEIQSIINKQHQFVDQLPSAEWEIISEVLHSAINALPDTFSLSGLSLGNLLLLGRMSLGDNLLQATDWARKLLRVKERILPVTLESVHLGAKLTNGNWVLGQSDLTTEKYSMPGKLERLCLLKQEDSYAFEVRPKACTEVLDLLNEADVFVLGFGSFLTSILPHFLVDGVGSTFRQRAIPKIFTCNPIADKESMSFTIESMFGILAKYAQQDDKAVSDNVSAITHILHFCPDKTSCVQTGDILKVVESGVRYIEKRKEVSFDEIASGACDEILSTLAGKFVQSKTQSLRLQNSDSASIVLFDLDSTLFDYPSLRKRATSAALENILPNHEATSEKLLQIFKSPVTDLLNSLGLPDLRRAWAAPEVFALGVVLGGKSGYKYLNIFDKFANSLKKVRGSVFFKERIEIYRCAKRLLEEGIAQELIDAIREALEHSDNNYFSTQVDVFCNYVENNATLFPGAEKIISELSSLGIEAHVVSEGDSGIQTFKFHSLRLGELLQTCVVTDTTCNIRLVLIELLSQFKDRQKIYPEVSTLYDKLVTYSIKSPSFYSKLLHALVDRDDANSLCQRIQTPRFLTAEEWEKNVVPSLVMVGDQFKKDIEPLLNVCQKGIQAYRVLTGKYSTEDPLHELIANHRVLPHGVFPDLNSLYYSLIAVARQVGERISRPVPALVSPALIDKVMLLCPELSEDSKMVLLSLKAEALRHGVII